MDHIRKAIERAKAPPATDGLPPPKSEAPWLQQLPNAIASNAKQFPRNEIVLNGARLESERIISHDVRDPRSKSFDMLRTQVLQTMDANSWQLIGVTSPSEGCGKSVVATNLAISIARQPEKSVLLVDMDLQRPRVANHLGLQCDQGLLSVLEGKSILSRAIIPVCIGNSRFLVLPCETSVPNSSEWMSSRSMIALLQEIKRDFRAWTVIFDLPPILLSDDVITILPQIDCVLFVAAVGISTTPQIKECNKHLESTPIVRIVLNKATDATTAYYPYSGYSGAPASRAKKKSKRGSASFGQSTASALKQFVNRLARY
jgi:protein-tyrosine kinase